MNTRGAALTYLGLLIAGAAIGAAIVFFAFQVGRLTPTGGTARAVRGTPISQRVASRPMSRPGVFSVSRLKFSVDKDYVYGSPDAPLSLISFMDFQCPFCRQFYDTAKRLVDGSGGNVNLVVRLMPLPTHERADTLAAASLCVGEQRGSAGFYAFADWVFTNQHAVAVDTPSNVKIAAALGLDVNRFDQCVDAGQYVDQIQTSSAIAKNAGFYGTPSNVLYNNKTRQSNVFVGAVSLEELQQRLKSL